MQSTDAPKIELSPQRAICARHGEPFRARWPAGYPVFSLLLVQHLLNDAGFMGETGGEVATINRLLDERPACCRVPPAKLLELYGEAKVGHLGFCETCRAIEMGTAYLAAIEGRECAFRHVCFRCVVYGFGGGH